MSNLNETCAGLIVTLSTTSLAFSFFHTWKFDRCRCLIPRKKEWFRVLLTWMLIGANMGLFMWGIGWARVKYDLGWAIIPDHGPLPVPPQLFPPKYKHYNIPLTIFMNVGYSLQASLNAEEGLYWFHLMRAVRQPKSARSWLNSIFFYVWILISVITTTVQCTVGWINTQGNPNLQIARELACGGAIELIVLICASTVLVKFPVFLRDVKASGAGPDVRSRLHFYHEANKVRTFFRAIFTITLLILGIDGCTKSATISMTPMASDLIIQMALGSFFLVLMISMMLYLPRNYSTTPRAGQVMIAPPQTRPPVDMQLTSGHALMSLLREGGQWDDDDDLRAGMTQQVSAPFDAPKTWSLGSKPKEEKWDVEVEERPALPSVLENFTSPIAITSSDANTGPIRIHVQREIQQREI